MRATDACFPFGQFLLPMKVPKGPCWQKVPNVVFSDNYVGNTHSNGYFRHEIRRPFTGASKSGCYGASFPVNTRQFSYTWYTGIHEPLCEKTMNQAKSCSKQACKQGRISRAYTYTSLHIVVNLGACAMIRREISYSSSVHAISSSS